ncbi:unnamed protein product [Parajaminaea phylloscopi]
MDPHPVRTRQAEPSFAAARVPALVQPISRPFMALSPNEEASAGDVIAGSKLSRGAKDVLFGSAAGMVAKVFEHPFDLIKVRLQTQPFTEPPPGSAEKPKGTLYSGAFDAFRSTVKKEGFTGLFRGLSMPIVGATLENATLFFTYNAIQGQLRRYNASQSTSTAWSDRDAAPATTSSVQLDAQDPLPLSQLAIAAAGAGAATSFALTPVELIKCRMQVQMISAEASILAQAAASGKGAASVTASTAEALNQARRSLPGPLTLFAATIRKEGVRGLWLGQTGTLLRETGGGIAWFLAFEATTRYFISLRSTEKPATKSDLSSPELMLAGALAGVSYNVVLFPADSVKSTIQTEAELAGPSARPSKFVPTLKRIWATRGIKGLYAGCGITCLRSGPSSALIFLLYNKLEGWADRRGW